ncbi:hypothetical protein ACFL96_15015 [Thermoproteota archaeon]
MEAIQYIGADELDPAEKADLDKLSMEYYDKIQRSLKNVTSIKIHIKAYAKEGGRKKFSIHISADAPTRKFQSTKASDWDFARTLHKAFKDLENQVVKAFKTDTGMPKNY